MAKSKSKATARKSKTNKESNAKLPNTFFGKLSKPTLFVIVFALIGLGTLLYSLAAVPTGQIKLRANGECLENFFDRKIDGNFLSTYPCDSNNKAQQWSIYSGDKSIRRDSTHCLDVQKGGTTPKTKVHLWRCTGGVPQKWDILSTGQLRNPNSKLCLEADSKDTFLGGPNLYVNTCNSSNTRQIWTVPQEAIPTPIPPLSPTNPTPEEPLPEPSSSARPSASNTGPASGAPTRGAIQATSGQVIRNVIIDAKGARYGVHVKSGIKGVVIENVIIKNAGSAGVYCEQKASCTIRNSEILEMQNDGIKIHGSALVEGNYIHHLGKESGSHADAVQMQYATNSNSTFRNNFCDIKFPPPSGYRSNACFQIQDKTTNVLIENNWLNGGNYTINCKSGTGVSGITIRNNWWGSHQYGRISGPCSETGGKTM